MRRNERGRGARRFGILLAVGVAVVAVGATAGQAGKNQDGYTLGLSNTLVGNGWREGQLCAFKAQALASGKVDSLRIAHRATDTAGQISDVRGMISAGVDAIVINPSSPTALKPVAAQARARGIEVVFIDQYVNAPGVYNASNDQVAYGRLGAEWLFKKMRGRGNVVEMRGIAGVPADTDRHKGFLQALKKYPNINVVKSVFTGWQFAPGAKQMLDILNSGTRVDGVWTSGIDYTVVDAFRTAGKRVRADRRRGQLRVRAAAQDALPDVPGRGGHEPLLHRRSRSGSGDPRARRPVGPEVDQAEAGGVDVASEPGADQPVRPRRTPRRMRAHSS